MSEQRKVMEERKMNDGRKFLDHFRIVMAAFIIAPSYTSLQLLFIQFISARRSQLLLTEKISVACSGEGNGLNIGWLKDFFDQKDYQEKKVMENHASFSSVFYRMELFFS